MNVVRSIIRYIPRCGPTIEPCGMEVTAHLIQAGSRWFIKSPWAMVNASSGQDTTDAQLASILRPCFASLAEAEQWARRESPHWHDRRNAVARDRWVDSRRWYDCFGPDRLADAMGISVARLSGIVCGKYKATPRESAAALAWKGGPVPA